MNDLNPAVAVDTPDIVTDGRRPAGISEGAQMLIHEAMARSRRQEAEEQARRHRLVRSVAAGRRWARLARYAEQRARRSAERARAAAG
ncbi:hypothetical protein ACFQ34_05430 [Pseudonocardia benzenivorans]|uniref:Uncharacterized protein n=2 Tax=Pseudonocardia TaxID=1847 RepID=F4CSG3_PSEUX|nr:hypothetical protein [Pseudonocardia dioxanivorans]AEA23368.1 hypothetical protein Psed_1117 [Pseudonocardia dioxanivorans CB1190]GJF04304.1 hypothetical protein PSD17_32600 [Pseudonocardia sp. D17]